MTIKVGDRLPSVTLREPTADGPKTLQTDDLTKGRRIVLFAVPGAFTPTCHRNHLPGFLANEAALRAKGVDEIAVVSVNDVHVMKAWEDATGAKGKIRFLADGNGDFARAVGLTLDGTGGGMGLRSQRYAMLVEDGVVKALNVEDAPGKADISSAGEMLKSL